MRAVREYSKVRSKGAFTFSIPQENIGRISVENYAVFVNRMKKVPLKTSGIFFPQFFPQEKSREI